MHSHDRTLISRLGFRDPDKKEPLHDLACRYFREPDVSKNIGEMFGISDVEVYYFEHRRRKPFWFTNDPWGVSDFVPCGVCYHDDLWDIGFSMKEITRHLSTTVELESPIQKHKGRSVAGFIDAVLHFNMEVTRIFDEDADFESGRGTHSIKECNGYFKIPVEVKINRVPIGDILRQIKFYRSINSKTNMPTGTCERDNDAYVLATVYEVSDDEREVLAEENIHHVLLGDNFQNYLRRSQSPISESTTVI